MVNDVWNGQRPKVKLLNVSSIIEHGLHEKFGTREARTESKIQIPWEIDISPRPEDNRDQLPTRLLPKIPEKGPRPYQEEAVDSWIEAGKKGVFAMATGTGKTFTALVSAVKLSDYIAESEERPLLVIVSAPQTDLVDQWRQEAKIFGFRTSICYGGIKKVERESLENAFFAANSIFGKRTEMIITTADSLTPQKNQDENEHYLQKKISEHSGPLLFIGDEMHVFGTADRLNALPQNAEYRIGLSATPQRHDDEEGTEELFEYFGDVVKEIDAREAIYDLGCLVPYHYEPRFIELTSDEHKMWKKLSAKIAAASQNEDALMAAAGKRNRVMQHADHKLSEQEDT